MKLLIQVISLLFNLDVGNELSSQEVALQVFSPLRIFTTVFGMGTGGFFSLGHQQTFVCCLPIILGFQLVRWKLHKIQYHQFITLSAYSRLCNQRLLRLLRFRFVRNGAIVVLRFQFVIAYAMPNSSSAPPCGFRKSPRPISNTRLKMLPLLHLCPINVVIYNGTY